TYRKGEVEVTLFGAVHIADASHYAALQQRFTNCDALLYELIAPADYRPRPRQDSDSGVLSMLQRAMKNALDLQFQLDAIDYTPDNFVHADLDGEEFQKQMEARGESLLIMLWSSMLKGMKLRQQGSDRGRPEQPSVDLVQAFKHGEGRHRLRLLLASQLDGFEQTAADSSIGGGDSTLIEGRDMRCLEVLQQQIAAGKQRLGIYFGVGHLPDLEQRLGQQLGFHKTGHEWLMAWDCTKRPDPKYDRAKLLGQQARVELAAIAKAARAWRRAHDRVPTFEQLTIRTNGVAPYEGVRHDPWGHDYELRPGAESGAFVVSSCGPDGKAGTDDDIALHEPAPEQPTPEVQMEATMATLWHAAQASRLQNGAVPALWQLTLPDADGRVYFPGEAADRWGQTLAIRSDPTAGIEVRSAGPDGVMDTKDDVVKAGNPTLRRGLATGGVSRELAQALAEKDLRKAYAAVEQYHRLHGRLPALAELVWPDSHGDSLLTDVVRDPWGTDYALRKPGRKGHSFELRSAGPDRQLGTRDDIVCFDDGAVRAGTIPIADEPRCDQARSDVRILQRIVMRGATGLGHAPTVTEVLGLPAANSVSFRGDGNDPWGHPYVIRAGRPGEFVVFSCGPDGIPDTDDDIFR
ncbi:MAG TPA: type II secretion system protein GspG, partial [Planctomycetota bacterium]|nr:type II secretion system protein GspG [Planctomycetota bacterium]